MTAQPLQPQGAFPATAVNWTMVGVIIAIAVQFAGAVAYGARAQAQIHELQATTEPLRANRGALTTRLDKLEESTKPLRDGQLVKIETDVAWIRRELERRPEGSR